MKNFEENNQISLVSASHVSSGYGHQRITVRIELNDEIETFSGVTDNMPDFDAAMGIEDYEEQQEALYELIANQIMEEISDCINNA